MFNKKTRADMMKNKCKPGVWHSKHVQEVQLRPRLCPENRPMRTTSPDVKRRAPFLVASDTEDLQAVVVADRDPVRLRGGPLHVVDLPFSRVGQDGVLDGARHLLDVPDQSLVVVRCREKQEETSAQEEKELWRRKKKKRFFKSACESNVYCSKF